jgi:hypothetical protein
MVAQTRISRSALRTKELMMIAGEYTVSQDGEKFT